MSRVPLIAPPPSRDGIDVENIDSDRSLVNYDPELKAEVGARKTTFLQDLHQQCELIFSDRASSVSHMRMLFTDSLSGQSLFHDLLLETLTVKWADLICSHACQRVDDLDIPPSYETLVALSELFKDMIVNPSFLEPQGHRSHYRTWVQAILGTYAVFFTLHQSAPALVDAVIKGAPEVWQSILDQQAAFMPGGGFYEDQELITSIMGGLGNYARVLDKRKSGDDRLWVHHILAGRLALLMWFRYDLTRPVDVKPWLVATSDTLELLGLLENEDMVLNLFKDFAVDTVGPHSFILRMHKDLEDRFSIRDGPTATSNLIIACSIVSHPDINYHLVALETYKYVIGALKWRFNFGGDANDQWSAWCRASSFLRGCLDGPIASAASPMVQKRDAVGVLACGIDVCARVGYRDSVECQLFVEDISVIAAACSRRSQNHKNKLYLAFQREGRRLWWPALKTLRDNPPSDASRLRKYQDLIHAWLKFGEAINLDEKSEGERHERERLTERKRRSLYALGGNASSTPSGHYTRFVRALAAKMLGTVTVHAR